MSESKSPQKKHADFQDRYRRSSNFRSVIKKEKFRIGEDGSLVINPKDQKDKERCLRKGTCPASDRVGQATGVGTCLW